MDHEAALLCNRNLPLLDCFVVELLDPTALHAHEMIVMAAFIELEHCLAALEMMAHKKTGLFELG
jgi:hypothetical protein